MSHLNKHTIVQPWLDANADDPSKHLLITSNSLRPQGAGIVRDPMLPMDYYSDLFMPCQLGKSLMINQKAHLHRCVFLSVFRLLEEDSNLQPSG
jgi:hypothetical protein